VENVQENTNKDGLLLFLLMKHQKATLSCDMKRMHKVGRETFLERKN
jgi:hypothetical protein